jgi:SAM-dependent methyltransferase
LRDEFGFSVSAVEYSDFGSEACARQGINVIQADATELPLEDHSIDGIVAMDVLEHIEDDNKVLREFCRVSKPNGSLFITVPAFRFLWSAHDEAVDHVRRYSKEELIAKVENAGFSINSIRYWNSLLFPLALITRLTGRSGSDLKIPPHFINNICSAVVKFERKSKVIGLLPGTSIIVDAHRLI